MAIHLVTGIPGHGKTLYMVGLLLDELIAECAGSGRQVFHNINGFDPGFENVHSITDDLIYAWADDDGPRNAIFVIDEAQFLFPVRNPSARVPAHVEKLSTHRHRGLDFYLITQHGSLLDRFIIPLIESHTDVYRPYGMKLSRVTVFPYYAPQVKHRATLQMGETKRLRFNPAHFSAYQSSTMHTYQPGLPWRKLALLGTVATLAVGGFVGGFVVLGRATPSEEVLDSVAGLSCAPMAIMAVGAATYPVDGRSEVRNIPALDVDCDV